MPTKQFPKPSLLSLGVAPVCVAAAAVFMERPFTEWSKTRSSVLPLSTLLLVVVLLHPRLRYLLMITLCYGVSFLAIRDIAHLPWLPLPAPLNYEAWDVLQALDLALVGSLAAMAGAYETFVPGTVWARRCYFGAAAGYFLGVGIVNYFRFGSWQSILLATTGVTAAIGCVFAHRIVSTEYLSTEEAELPSDEMLQQAREAAHRAALQAKEWRDNLVTARDERDTPSAGSV